MRMIALASIHCAVLAWQTGEYHGRLLPPESLNLRQQSQYKVRTLLPRDQWSMVFVNWARSLVGDHDSDDSDDDMSSGESVSTRGSSMGREGSEDITSEHSSSESD